MRYLSIAILSILLSIGCSPPQTVKYADGSTVKDGDIVHVAGNHASVYHPRRAYARVKLMNTNVHNDYHDVTSEFLIKCNPKTCEIK